MKKQVHRYPGVVVDIGENKYGGDCMIGVETTHGVHRFAVSRAQAVETTLYSVAVISVDVYPAGEELPAPGAPA